MEGNNQPPQPRPERVLGVPGQMPQAPSPDAPVGLRDAMRYARDVGIEQHRENRQAFAGSSVGRTGTKVISAVENAAAVAISIHDPRVREGFRTAAKDSIHAAGEKIEDRLIDFGADIEASADRVYTATTTKVDELANSANERLLKPSVEAGKVIAKGARAAPGLAAKGVMYVGLAGLYAPALVKEGIVHAPQGAEYVAKKGKDWGSRFIEFSKEQAVQAKNGIRTRWQDRMINNRGNAAVKDTVIAQLYRVKAGTRDDRAQINLDQVRLIERRQEINEGKELLRQDAKAAQAWEKVFGEETKPPPPDVRDGVRYIHINPK